jgi:hypothetical protein
MAVPIPQRINPWREGTAEHNRYAAEYPLPPARFPRRHWFGWLRSEEEAFAERVAAERRILAHWAAGGTLADFPRPKRSLFKGGPPSPFAKERV